MIRPAVKLSCKKPQAPGEVGRALGSPSWIPRGTPTFSSSIYGRGCNLAACRPNRQTLWVRAATRQPSAETLDRAWAPPLPTVLLCLLQADSRGFQDFKIYKNPALDRPSFYSWGYEVREGKGLAKATQRARRRAGTRPRAPLGRC